MNINELINEELERAAELHGDRFTSRHQGYAVLLEEVEELRSAVNGLETVLEALWGFIKRDNVNVQELLKSLEETSNNAIEESVQVGAMIKKLKDFYKDKYPDVFKFWQ